MYNPKYLLKLLGGKLKILHCISIFMCVYFRITSPFLDVLDTLCPEDSDDEDGSGSDDEEEQCEPRERASWQCLLGEELPEEEDSSSSEDQADQADQAD